MTAEWRKMTVFILILVVVALLPHQALAMHISEGILPATWAGLWFLVSVPFLALGLRQLKVLSKQAGQLKPLIGLVGAAIFIISAMPIPVPTAGTSSHPAGTGLAAILIGPTLTVVVASVALTLQALFLAHGGLTTLGANIVSMGIAGAFAGYGVFRLSRRLGLTWFVAAFLAGLFSDWATYAVTSLELASALHAPGSFKTMLWAILLAFMPTQVPLGLLEGFVCAGAYRFIMIRRPDLLKTMTGGTAL